MAIRSWATKTARANHTSALLQAGLVHLPHDTLLLEALRAADEEGTRAILAPVHHAPARCSTLGTKDERPMLTEGMAHGTD